MVSGFFPLKMSLLASVSPWIPAVLPTTLVAPSQLSLVGSSSMPASKDWNFPGLYSLFFFVFRLCLSISVSDSIIHMFKSNSTPNFPDFINSIFIAHLYWLSHWPFKFNMFKTKLQIIVLSSFLGLSDAYNDVTIYLIINTINWKSLLIITLTSLFMCN